MSRFVGKSAKNHVRDTAIPKHVEIFKQKYFIINSGIMTFSIYL